MLELYHSGLTTCSKQVRHCLREKGLRYESRYVELWRYENLSPDYLALNPNGVVPTLVHDGVPIINSFCINEYIEDAFPEPALRPANLTIEAWVNFGALNSALSGSAPAGSQYLVFKQNSRASFFEGYALEKYRMPKGDVFLFIVASSSSQEVCYDCPLRLSLSPRALLSPARFVTRPALLRGD